MNVVDYVILGMLGISLLFGLYRGFISSVLNTGGALLSFILSFVLSPKLAAMIQNNEELVRTLLHYTDAANRIGDLEISLQKVASLGESGIRQVVEKANLPEPLSTLLTSNLTNQVWSSAGLSTVSDYVSQTILNAAINIICFLITFLVLFLVISIVVNLLKAVFRFPLLKQMDALVGGVFGLARGVLLCYVFFAIVPLIMTMVPVDFLQQLLDESTLAPIFNNGTLILSIMNGRL